MIVTGEFIEKTKKIVLTQSFEYQKDSMAGKWEASGATEHSKDFHGRFNWLHPITFSKFSNIHESKVSEFLEKNNLDTKAEYDKSINVLNREGDN